MFHWGYWCVVKRLCLILKANRLLKSTWLLEVSRVVWILACEQVGNPVGISLTQFPLTFVACSSFLSWQLDVSLALKICSRRWILMHLLLVTLQSQLSHYRAFLFVIPYWSLTAWCFTGTIKSFTATNFDGPPCPPSNHNYHSTVVHPNVSNHSLLLDVSLALFILVGKNLFDSLQLDFSNMFNVFVVVVVVVCKEINLII